MEDFLDDLKEDTLAGFLMGALSRFTIPEEIFIATDGYHYRSILEMVSAGLNLRTRRQRCPFHIEKDVAYRTHDAGKENELDNVHNQKIYFIITVLHTVTWSMRFHYLGN